MGVEPTGDINVAEKELEETRIIFDPPLYQQRYTAVYDAIINHPTPIKSVADLGCSEGNLLRYLKSVKHMEKIVAVDMDNFALTFAARKIEPVVADYIMGRSVQLEVYIYEGNICKPDSRLIGIDAILCVEVIEHMDESKVDDLVKCIFGVYKPKLVAITTPNFDYNVVFGNKNTVFRHYDHKFEWTRAQFQDWCENIATTYPDYSNYEITGVGLPTEDFPDVGHASQIAFFNLRSDEKEAELETEIEDTPENESIVEESYKELWHFTYEYQEQEKFVPVDWSLAS